MEQLSAREAIAFAEGDEWREWNSFQIAAFQLGQKKCCVPFVVFHKALEDALDRSVLTHEMGLNWAGLLDELLGRAPTPTVQEILDLIPKEKRIILKMK